MTLVAVAIPVFAGIGFAAVLYRLMFWRSDKRMEDRVNAKLDEIMRYHHEAKAHMAAAEKTMASVKEICLSDADEVAAEVTEVRLLN